jgi:hypothetical protein
MAGRSLAFSLLLAWASSAAAAPLQLGSRYKDESNGFQIQVPRKWEQVPTKFQEVSILGKWGGEAKRGMMNPELVVLRFLNASAVDEPKQPADAFKPGMPGYEDLLRYQEKDVWEYVKKSLGDPPMTEEDKDLKMSAKNLRGHLRVYRRSDWGGLVVVAAEIRTIEPSDSSFGVVYACAEADEKDMLRTFRSSIQRFRILELDQEEEADEAEEGEEAGPRITDADIFVDSSTKPEAWREARKKKIENLKDWDALDTPNYLIVYNKEVKRPLLRKIAAHIEAIRRDVYEKLFPPTNRVTAISVVRVCRDRAEYHRYGGPGGSAGYWSRGDEELVLYEDQSNKKDSLRVLYHEAFHQYIHYAVGDVAPHSWFNEGHGDYFAGHNYSAGKFKSAPFRWRTGIIANALAQKTYVPLDRFLKFTQGEYYSNPGLCYAQGWSFVYFLREAEQRKIRKYEKYWGLLDRYFDAIKRNVQVVKDKGLYGLEDLPQDPAQPPAPPPGEETAGAPEGPTVPGLEQPFPGENPLEGTGEGVPVTATPSATGERRTVAGPEIKDVRSALDAAVDEAFRGIDLSDLEKDWIEFSK